MSVGAWFIGLGFGVLLGARFPHRMLVWKNGAGIVVLGSLFVGLVLATFMTYGRQRY